MHEKIDENIYLDSWCDGVMRKCSGDMCKCSNKLVEIACPDQRPIDESDDRSCSRFYFEVILTFIPHQSGEYEGAIDDRVFNRVGATLQDLPSNTTAGKQSSQPRRNKAIFIRDLIYDHDDGSINN